MTQKRLKIVQLSPSPSCSHGCPFKSFLISKRTVTHQSLFFYTSIPESFFKRVGKHARQWCIPLEYSLMSCTFLITVKQGTVHIIFKVRIYILALATWVENINLKIHPHKGYTYHLYTTNTEFLY